MSFLHLSKKKKKPAHKFLAKNKFGAKVLALEMKVEIDELNMKDVYNLIALYSEAIDYFTSQGDGSFVFFKLKLQRLLSLPRVTEMINQLEVLKKKMGLKTSKKLLEKIVSPAPNIDLACKKKNFDNYKNHTLKKRSSNDRQQTLKRHASITSMNDEKVNNDLDKQKENFKERLAQRRENSRSRRSQSIGSNRKHRRNLSNASLGLGAMDDEQMVKTDGLLDEYGGVFGRGRTHN